MLGSISLLGERARSRKWSITVAALAAGAILGGAALGATVGVVGELLPIGSHVAAGLLAGTLAVAALIDIFWLPRRIGPVRQVNDQWLVAFRGWAAGAGFGLQLGVALATVVNSASTYVVLAAMALTHSVGSAVLIGAVYGGTRALTVLLGGFVRTPTQLARVDRRLVRADRPASLATAAATLAVFVVLMTVLV